jgi:hypothetical protein
MRLRLTDQQELKPLSQQRSAERFMPVQLIAEHADAQRGVFLAPTFHPAPGGVEFTVLFRLPILRLDEFRGEWDHFIATGLDQYRRQHRVKIADLAVSVTRGRATRAIQFLR